MPRKYDSSVARMAGNIAAGIAPGFNFGYSDQRQQCAEVAVALARAIVAEVQRTEPTDADASKEVKEWDW